MARVLIPGLGNQYVGRWLPVIPDGGAPARAFRRRWYWFKAALIVGGFQLFFYGVFLLTGDYEATLPIVLPSMVAVKFWITGNTPHTAFDYVLSGLMNWVGFSILLGIFFRKQRKPPR
jgi:hypothetical protein